MGLVHVAEVDPFPPRGRAAALGLLTLFQPELLPFLPWHISQGPLLTRVLSRYVSRLYNNYAARVRRLRTKMKVVPQYKADRPNIALDLDRADDSGAVLDEKSRKFLPTAVMCGLESEMMLAEVEGRGLQISRGTVSAGMLLEKHWTLRNLGKVAWPKRAKLVCIGGDEPGLDVLAEESDLEIPGWVGPGAVI